MALELVAQTGQRYGNAAEDVHRTTSLALRELLRGRPVPAIRRDNRLMVTPATPAEERIRALTFRDPFPFYGHSWEESRKGRPVIGSLRGGVYIARGSDGSDYILRYASDATPRGLGKLGRASPSAVAASRLDSVAGCGLISPTAIVIGPDKNFCLAQRYVPGKSPAPDLHDHKYPYPQLAQAAALDYVLGMGDRYREQYILTDDNRLGLIDHHEYCLRPLPSVLSDKASLENIPTMQSEFVVMYLNKDLPDEVVTAMRNVDPVWWYDTIANLGLGDKAAVESVARLLEVQQGRITGEAWPGRIIGENA